jgi:hypothetical protein
MGSIPHDKLRWTVLGFNAYKSFSMDGIFLALLQGLEIIINPKMKFSKACTALR